MDDVELRSSLGIVKNYFKTKDDVQIPTSNYDLLFDMYANDAVLTTAIDTTVDVATAKGYSFVGDNKRAVKELTKLFDDVLDFDEILPNIVAQMLIYGDSFLELRRFDNAVKELHSLETTEMFIRYDEHGKVLGYVQRPYGSIGSSPTSSKIGFATNNIIHFALKRIGSGLYSKTPFQSIYKEYATKKRSIGWLSQIFTNYPPRLMYILKNASKGQVKNFVDNLKVAKNNPHKDMIALGDTEVKQTGFSDFNPGLVEVLNYLRSEILMITKVPPIWVGLPDNSNRANSDAQIRSFETRVKSIQKKIESQVNKKLLHELGHKNVKFQFNPFSLTEENLILTNAKVLLDIGTTTNSLQEYLVSKGIVVELKTEEDKLLSQQKLMNVTNPSEEGSDEGKSVVDEGKEDLVKRQTGSDKVFRDKDSARKLKETETRSIRDYPYTYEVVENAF